MHHCTEKFKKEVVKKILTPGVVQKDICEKLNITYHTITKWKSKYRKEIQAEVEQQVLDSIQPEVEEDVDIEKLLFEIERSDLSEEKLNQEQTIDKILSKGKLPKDYNRQEKYSIVQKARSLEGSELGMFYRRAGLQSQHIKLFEEELISMSKKEIDKSDYIKKLEAENKKLQKHNKELERDKNELQILIELKKKYPTLFKNGEED
jgi:transposase-like protein